MSFVHLHVASAFSSHYGVTRPELLAEAAASLGMTALAITDRDGLYGAVKHIGACQTLGISPIVGVELSLVDDDGVPLARCVILARGHDNGIAAAGVVEQCSKAGAMSASGAGKGVGEDPGRVDACGRQSGALGGEVLSGSADAGVAEDCGHNRHCLTARRHRGFETRGVRQEMRHPTWGNGLGECRLGACLVSLETRL